MGLEIPSISYISQLKSNYSPFQWQSNTDFCRYILKQEYHNATPFIRTDRAHLNISFSCISYLNTSLCLLPDNCTDQERAAIILQGFHGLQLYANQFWAKHILTCCNLLSTCDDVLPDEMIAQLEKLVRFRKQMWQDSSVPETLDLDGDSATLQQLPHHIRGFIREVSQFREGLTRNEYPHKSPKGKSERISALHCR